MEFRFRKYINPKDYASEGLSTDLPDYPAFKTGGIYLAYNARTGSGVLKKNSENGWDGAIVLSVTATDRDYQDYFKRTWVEEDGVDVYLDGARKHNPAKNTIEMLLRGSEEAVRDRFEHIVDTINGFGVFEFYDTYNKALRRLVLDKVSIIKDVERGGSRFIHFKLECTNVLGYDKRDFNPASGNND